MSLRVFHVLFIVASVALSLGSAIWGIEHYRLHGGALGPTIAAVFFVSGALLVLYGARFFRKLKELS